MTDGPFKNLKLDSRWQKFVEAVRNDVVDMEERRTLASHALIREILDNDNQLLLADIQAFVKREQLDLDLLSAVEYIFGNHAKTPFSDSLQKEMLPRLSDRSQPSDAFRQAVEATVIDMVGEVKNRIEEECICVCESGEMRYEDFGRIVAQSSETLHSLAIEKICDALCEGDQNAFKQAASKKIGLDEGPAL